MARSGTVAVYAWERMRSVPTDGIERLLSRIARGYNRACSIDEIRTQPVLQWMFGASLFYFFVSFEWLLSNSNLTVEAAKSGLALCWPYFQNCGDLYFLHAHPYGYSQSALYMLFYAIMCLIVYLMWKRQWGKAHTLLSLLLAWKLFVIFVLSYSVVGPYDYYHVILTFVLLFAAHKEFFLKLSFVWMYFMSVTVKFTSAWELGTYFTSMRLGLPLFPSWATVVLTNFVIFVQIIDCWFLMSRRRVLQRISFAIAVFFHLYSGVLVLYNYPSVALPPVLILFGPLYRYSPIPFTRKAVIGWAVILVVGLFQLLGFVVSPNRFLTLEGHRYGMFMFEANHQCTATIRTVMSGEYPVTTWRGLQCTNQFCLTSSISEAEGGKTTYTRTWESASAWNRCDPYETWTLSKARCNDPRVERIGMEFNHSINGGPFYRIVDEENICDLTYKPFSHNEWIKVPPEAPVVGYPVENFYTIPD